MKVISFFYNKFPHLILYGIIGSFTAALDFATFYCLNQFVGLYYLIANCVSVLVGISTSFFLNRSYNFKVKDKPIRRFLTFLSVGLAGLCLSNLILWIGIDFLQLDEIFTKLLSIVLVVFFQFLLNKYITFKVEKL